ncbi:MAG: hypothetical protein ACTHJ8_10605, partial [Mucilaginibacter sp.]
MNNFIIYIGFLLFGCLIVAAAYKGSVWLCTLLFAGDIGISTSEVDHIERRVSEQSPYSHWRNKFRVAFEKNDTIAME